MKSYDGKGRHADVLLVHSNHWADFVVLNLWLGLLKAFNSYALLQGLIRKGTLSTLKTYI